MSLEENYGSRDKYSDAISGRAILVKDRLLLPDDAKAYVERASSDPVARLFN